jgi:hypothetical protein
MSISAGTVTTIVALARIFVEWIQSAEDDDEKAAKLAWISAKNLLKKEALKKARGG